MVRGKIEMKKIESSTSRQVTFSKRRNGLLKKAHELSVLCDAEIAVIIFSQKGRLYKFASSDLQKTIERYNHYVKQARIHPNGIELQKIEQIKHETASLVQKIGALAATQRKLLGQELNSCSIEELHEIDNQLEQSLRSIRARKEQLYREEIAQLKAKEQLLLDENMKLLTQKYSMMSVRVFLSRIHHQDYRSKENRPQPAKVHRVRQSILRYSLDYQCTLINTTHGQVFELFVYLR
ncbi:MADS-box protein AGL42-like protein [Drosera capensis]